MHGVERQVTHQQATHPQATRKGWPS